ncbi:MAG: cellulase-like family protein [Nocardioides sp.]
MTADLRPVAITMWDFSWLERRWPGAGYEDWDLVLDELVDRGYDAVRIDAYPHLVSADADKLWTLLPPWTQNTWGAQSRIDVQVQPALVDFIRKAGARGVKVGLSSWFRQDVDDLRMRISSPADMARIWVDTLRVLDDADVLEHVLFVDLCNEFPVPMWTPFLYGTGSGRGFRRTDRRIPAYMRESIDLVRAAYPVLSYTYSFGGQYDDCLEQDVTALDFLEPHLWMALDDVSDYYVKAGYSDYEQSSPVGYDNLAARGREVYLAEQETWDGLLFDAVDALADWSRATGKALVTTECWAVIDYKDWPGLDWDWVLDLNARAVERVLATGRWVGVATSNFCGPQFVGCWREVEYHQRLTRAIKGAAVDTDLILPPALATLLTPNATTGAPR